MTANRTNWLRALVVACLAVGLAGSGCNTPGNVSSNTGILLRVELDSSVTEPVDGLRFFVGIMVNADPPVFQLDGAASGLWVDITDWDLPSNPYELLIYDNGDGTNQTIKVAVVGENQGVPVAVGWMDDPPEQAFEKGSIVERTIVLNPINFQNQLTWTQTNCLASVDPTIRFGSETDADCDGYEDQAFGGADCNDLHPFVNPGADDQFNCDGLDNDCNGTIDDGGWTDNDQDGTAACDGDCRDFDPNVHPGAQERCDGVDNDCDGMCDEGFDEDDDGYTSCSTFKVWDDVNQSETCVFLPFTDCDDNNPNVNPGAPEDCDGFDNNCNGLCDEGFDLDQDGFNECGSWQPSGVDPTGTVCIAPDDAFADCGPNDPLTNPGMFELCDGKDNNCDSQLDPIVGGCWELTSDANGPVCERGTRQCTESPGSFNWGNCSRNGTDTDPLSYCGLWNDICNDAVDPDGCVLRNMIYLPVDCRVYMDQAGTSPCIQPPVFYSPFGFSALTTCQWDISGLQVQPIGWEYGLVDPAGPYNPVNLLNTCDGGLVGFPNSGMAGNTSIAFDVGFQGTSATEAYYMHLDVTITVENVDCSAVTEGMVCFW